MRAVSPFGLFSSRSVQMVCVSCSIRYWYSPYWWGLKSSRVASTAVRRNPVAASVSITSGVHCLMFL